MALDDLKQRIQSKMTQALGLEAKVKFDFGDNGFIFVDTTQQPAMITSDEDGDAETTLKCDLQTFTAILDGTQDPNVAFMMGKLKVEGSMGLAMKLNSILED